MSSIDSNSKILEGLGFTKCNLVSRTSDTESWMFRNPKGSPVKVNLLSESDVAFAAKPFSHKGITRSKAPMFPIEHGVWQGIIHRCSAPCEGYYDRGIKVCERWRWSFDAFIEDMDPKPYKSASIDRIDVNGGYEPSNCRWASKQVQSRNKTNTKLYLFQGEWLIPVDIARMSGCNHSRLTVMLKTGHKADEASLSLIKDGRYAYCC